MSESAWEGVKRDQLIAWCNEIDGAWLPIPVAARVSEIPEFTLRTLVRRKKLSVRRGTNLLLVNRSEIAAVVERRQHAEKRRCLQPGPQL